MLEDSYRHKGLRKKLVEEIGSMGITDKKVLDAMNAVPRHYFLTSAFLEFAYNNKAFQIGEDQTISHPYTVGLQSSLLQIEPGMKVLEIGTGSGYQCAVLCELGAKVYSIERHRPLHINSKKLLEKMGYKPYLSYGDGFKGLPALAPFDRILFTCAVPKLPDTLLMQLKPGGILVMPFGEGDIQKMMAIKEQEDGSFTTTYHGDFSFVPMLEKRAAKK
jgi:protein-L-isoaspartate(D-aspartate) O-methyltransferase